MAFFPSVALQSAQLRVKSEWKTGGLYTAVTRGRRLVVLVGSERALKMAVSQSGVIARWSGLKERLRGDTMAR